MSNIHSILEFIAPSSGQVIELPNNRFLIHFTDEGSDYRVAWFTNGKEFHAMNIQTCTLNRVEPSELEHIKQIIHNPHMANVIGEV